MDTHRKDHCSKPARRGGVLFCQNCFPGHWTKDAPGRVRISKLIYETTPTFITKPYGFGEFPDSGLTAYFYLSQFVELDIEIPPDPDEFTQRLAYLHKMSRSPTGKFGFPVPTRDGDRPHIVDWQDSWAVFFRYLFLGVCRFDIARNGQWPEYERAIQQIADKVIPILLEPLQANGRKLKPCLIHGDLWEGNMGINLETGDSMIFDAASYFSHNEMEFGHW
jgi:Fructosamine-3-kinase